MGRFNRSGRVAVRVDGRVRTLGAALAMTDWPEREKRLGLVKAHHVAEHARQWLARYQQHPAIKALQALVAQDVPLRALYAYVLGLNEELSPEHRATGLLVAPVPQLESDELAGLLARLRADSQLDALWYETRQYWERAAADATRVLTDTEVGDYLALLFGNRRLPVFVPNLLYPAHIALGIAARGEAVCICPPPEAVGESPPWNYGDDPEWTRMATFRECCHATLRGLHWVNPVDATTVELLSIAATAVFLRETDDPAGAKALVLMETKRGLTRLTAAVDALGRYAAAREADQQHDMIHGLQSVADQMMA
jgi:hypothetical protein